VQTSHFVQSSDGAASLPARIGGALLVLAILFICYFSGLGMIGFVGNEEHYASIAHTMVETGDWVTPHLNGAPWFEKPPLYYWGAALSFKFFGFSEAAARFPCAVSALLATLALAWLAWRLYGAETVRWLLLILPTTIAMIAFSHDAVMDMPFSGTLTIAMVFAAVRLRLVPPRDFGRSSSREPPSVSASSNFFSAVGFGCFLGLAVLAKGPAALVLCGGAVFLWALVSRRWRDASRLLHPGAIAAFCVTALPWYILCAHRNPSFFTVFIVEHNFKRFLTPQFMHIKPFWYYIPALLLGLLPWTPGAIWGAVQGSMWLRRSKSLSSHTLFLLSWVLFVVIFFSCARTKMPGYVLPAVPFLSLLSARACERLAFERRISFAATLVGFALAGCVRPQIAVGLDLQFAGATIPQFLATVVLLAMGAANVILATGVLCAKRPSTRGWIISLSGVPILFLLIAAPAFVSRSPADRIQSKDIASQLEARQMPGEVSPHALKTGNQEGNGALQSCRAEDTTSGSCAP
jgi:4-amino-4-deoxy-L-arabinose transferase-like glycosyltransferase